MWNMFKVNKNTNKKKHYNGVSDVILLFLVLIWYFTPFSSVPIVDFE